MQIRLVDFTEDTPTEVHHSYDAKDLDLEFDDLKYTTSLELTGTVEKGHDILVFHGRVISDLERTCGRCLVSVKNHLERPFELVYEIKGKEVLETLNDLREVLILDHTISYICREDCRGLCTQCGANRNETTCQCVDTGKTSGISSIREIRTRSQKEKKKNA